MEKKGEQIVNDYLNLKQRLQSYISDLENDYFQGQLIKAKQKYLSKAKKTYNYKKNERKHLCQIQYSNESKNHFSQQNSKVKTYDKRNLIEENLVIERQRQRKRKNFLHNENSKKQQFTGKINMNSIIQRQQKPRKYHSINKIQNLRENSSPPLFQSFDKQQQYSLGYSFSKRSILLQSNIKTPFQKQLTQRLHSRNSFASEAYFQKRHRTLQNSNLLYNLKGDESQNFFQLNKLQNQGYQFLAKSKNNTKSTRPSKRSKRSLTSIYSNSKCSRCSKILPRKLKYDIYQNNLDNQFNTSTKILFPNNIKIYRY